MTGERKGKKVGKHICDFDEGNLWFGQSSLQVGFQPERQQQGGAGNWGQSEGSVLVSLMFRIQCEMSYLSSISCRIDIWYAIFMIFDVYIRDENNLVMIFLHCFEYTKYLKFFSSDCDKWYLHLIPHLPLNFAASYL